MIFEHHNYRTFLREVLSQRTQANPSYSLRALARSLGLSGSQLSEVMSGKNNLSSTSARKVAVELDLNSRETDYFCLSVQIETEKSLEVREKLIEKLNEYRPVHRAVNDLSIDVYRQIADWHYAAILELVSLTNFKLSPESISEKLNISKIDATVALDRLERLELLIKDQNGNWYKPKDELLFASKEKSSAMRSHYRQILEKVSQSLDDQEPFKERLSGYETLAFPAQAMPEAQQIFDRFFEDMIKLSKKYPKKNDVYHLVAHFLNLTPKNKSERKRKS